MKDKLVIGVRGTESLKMNVLKHSVARRCKLLRSTFCSTVQSDLCDNIA